MMLAKSNASWFKKVLTFQEWTELKKKQGGGLPVVTLADGTMLSESIPTSRYIAKKCGFYPGDALLAHRCDFTVGAFTDAYFAFFDAVTSKDNEKISAVVNEKFPAFLNKIEEGLGKMKWMAGE